MSGFACCDDAGAFLEQAGPLLLADEARHNLILGISGTLRESPDRYIEKRLLGRYR